MNFTPEQMNKAKQAKTAKELLALAKASGIKMTEDEAKKYFAELHKEGELNDDELASVAGGKDDNEIEPKEYSVTANWAPSCDGKYQQCRGMAVPYSKDTDMCGKCIHFKYEGSLTFHTQGVCRREFE